MENVRKLIDQLVDQKQLIKAIINSPREKTASTLKITIRPVTIKGEHRYQMTSFDGRQTRDFNATPSELKQRFLDLLTEKFKQALITTSQIDYHLMINSKGKATILQKKGSNPLPLLEHNRKKDYLLEEGAPIPFLIALGIMSVEGKVVAKKYDKFKQINRFLEMIDDLLPAFKADQQINIVDFGCGKSYLTFALYHLLTARGYPFTIVGLDLKKEVIEQCNLLARKLDYQGLNFQVGDISHYVAKQQVDLVVVLHACDTATDAALAQAIRWNAKAILAVPCCQHELYTQIKNEALAPLLHHGILKERFAALATDALRAQILEIKGYKTQILEFIDLEHTPKNLLIRAVKQENRKEKELEKLTADYKQLKKSLNANPALENMLNDPANPVPF